MSGRRHHYIPQFLLRGFTSRRHKKACFVWRFGKDHTPYESNIINVAVESEFYGKPEDPLDELITDRESTWAEALRQLRQAETLADDASSTLGSFLTVMMFRTDYLRTGLVDTATRMLRAAGQHHTMPGRVESLVRREFEKRVPAIKELTRSQMGGLPFDEAAFDRAMDEARQSIDASAQSAERYIEGAIDDLVDSLPKLGANAHNKALTEHVSLDEITPVRERFESLAWTATSYKPRTLILGDLAVLGYDSTQDELFPLPADAMRADVVLLPISHQLLLVGTKGAQPALPTLDRLNSASAGFSRSFFVAARSTDAEATLANRIGTHPNLIPEDQVQRLIDENISDADDPLDL